MKSESPDLFRVSPVTEMQDLFKMQMQQVLSQHNEHGPVVYMFRVREYLHNLHINMICSVS